MDLKREIVEKIEKGEFRLHEVVKAYEVTYTSIYKWMMLYGKEKRPERMVVEKQSEGYVIAQLKKELSRRDAAIGELHMELRYKNKVLELASLDLGYDVEKKTNAELSKS